MIKYQSKLHPSTCFPPNPTIPTTQNRLFIRISPKKLQQTGFQLTFIGINSLTYSSIAGLLTYRKPISIESIRIFDLYQKHEARAIFNDLQLISALNHDNIRLVLTQSYWETKDSTIVIINVQHNRLENERISTWIQNNTKLIENVVSQVAIYSPNATLIICTQPNELMTYVAAHVSKFPIGRVFGLGSSVQTAYAHRTILNQMNNIHGQVNGYFILGNGTCNTSYTTIFANNLTVNGIDRSDICSKVVKGSTIAVYVDNIRQSTRAERNSNEWNLIEKLENHEILFSNVTRQSTRNFDIKQRQKTVKKYLVSNCRTTSNILQAFQISTGPKQRSNWAEALIIVRIIRALIHGDEFQSNLTVNIAPINDDKDVFICYPTIIGSSHHSPEHILPFTLAESLFKERSFLIPYEKLQRKTCLSKSKD